jgi:hypothetical protein
VASYCVESDLWDFGVPRGSIPNAGRLAADPPANASTDRIELDGHGLSLNDPVSFRAEGGGSLPSPLVAGTAYFAIPYSDAYFQVSATLGGPAIDLTTAGGGVVVLQPLPVDAAIEFASALIDDMLPAHAVPLVYPYPPIVTMTCAELAAARLAARSGAASVSLTGIADAARKRLERWAQGIPLRGTNTATQTPTNLATSAVAAPVDSRGYVRWGGTGNGGGPGGRCGC